MAVDDQNNAQGGGEQLEAGLGDGTITFTQAQFDRLVGERVARERQKYGDYDDLKAKAAKLAELEDAQKSELQRAQDAREAAEKTAQAALTNANVRLIQAEFIAAAALAGVAHPEDAFALADRAVVQIGDDGKVTGVTEQVKTLVDAGRLVMQSGPRAPRLDAGAGAGDRTTGSTKPTPDQEAYARKMGIPINEYMEYATKK